MSMSVSTTSGCRDLASFSACRPSTASTTSYPPSPRASRATSRFVARSSTTRTVVILPSRGRMSCGFAGEGQGEGAPGAGIAQHAQFAIDQLCAATGQMKAQADRPVGRELAADERLEHRLLLLE